MNISFDLDSTLIPHGKEFEVEPLPSIFKIIGIENIRKGARELMRQLRSNNHSIHIYTTSYRSIFKIRLTLAIHGIRVDKIINQYKNERILNTINKSISKYPPAFGFDLHIDDSLGVKKEGKKHHFNVIHIAPNSSNWTQEVLNNL